MKGINVVLFDHINPATKEGCTGGRKEVPSASPRILWKKQESWGVSIQPMATCPNCHGLREGIEVFASQKPS